MIYLLKVVIFHTHVGLLEGNEGFELQETSNKLHNEILNR